MYHNIIAHNITCIMRLVVDSFYLIFTPAYRRVKGAARFCLYVPIRPSPRLYTPLRASSRGKNQVVLLVCTNITHIMVKYY